MKTFFGGALVIVLLGIGGLVYRNAIEMRSQVIACPTDAKVCPDGTAVGRIGTSCVFPECPPPNVSLPDLGISFAVPAEFEKVEVNDPEVSLVYERVAASSTPPARILIHRYPIAATSTALATIQETALGDPSGLPVSATSYTSATFGQNHFTVVRIGRFEGVVITAYYLARSTEVLRFDAVDQNVSNWMDSRLDISVLPAHQALRTLLSTLSGI